MANSRKPGPANPPMDWCLIPALTNGPLGLFDQGDPNVTTLLGDTPGPLGMNDWNDPTIGCFHNALATLSWDADDDFMGKGVGGAVWPIEPPVNQIARGAHRSSVTGKSAAAGVDGSPATGAVTDFIAVANTRGSYPSQGMTDYQGNNVAYITSFNSATGYWEQSTGDGFLINAISWAPRDAAPETPRSAMSLSMTLQSDSLYTAGRSFLGDAYRVAVHEVLNPDNTWAIRTGYGLSALVVAIPGFLNDLSRDLYNSPNDLYVGGKGMSAGWTDRDPYRFSDGLMRFSIGLLSAAGGAAIAGKGIVSNRLATSNPAVRATHVEGGNAAKFELDRARSSGNMANQRGAQRVGASASELGTEGKFKESSPAVLARKNNGSQISNLKTVSAAEANTPFISDIATAQGWLPPYADRHGVRTFTTADDLPFVRLHTEADNAPGGFLVRQDEIAHLGNNPAAIQNYLGLKDIPAYISNATVPAGTRMQVGIIGPQPNFGLYENSGMQYQLLEQIPRSSFYNTRPLQ